MPDAETQYLYPIEHLLPHITAGRILLTPNQRLARRLRAEWNQRQREASLKAWQPLAAYALDDWLRQVWEEQVLSGQMPPRVILSHNQQRELWQAVIASELAEDAALTLIQPAATAAMASQARDLLLRWRLDPHSEPVLQRFDWDPDCSAFRRWLQRFEAELAARDVYTPLDVLVELGQSTPTEADQPEVVLLEFEEVPPLQRHCLERLTSAVIELQAPDTNESVAVTHYDERRAELSSVARWARETAQPGVTVGIVLPDMANDRPALEYLLRREFDCLGDRYASLPVNFSTGLALDRVPVVRDALRILGLTGRQFPLRDVVALLGGRFTTCGVSDSPGRIQLLRRLYAQAREEIDVGQLRFEANREDLGGEDERLFGKALLELSTRRELRERLMPSDWVGQLHEVLNLFGWPGAGPLDSLEYQQVDAWYDALDTFAGCDAVVGALSLEEAIALLRRVLAAEISQPQSADSNIQVLGPLEAAGLAFDHLWVCALQAASWPAPARPHPLIPVAIQRQHGMPHSSAAREWAFSEHLLNQYRRLCRHLHASYAVQVDGVPELPSALLDGFEDKPGDPVDSVDRDWLERHRAGALQLLDDAAAPPVAARELEQLRGGSALIEDQSQCPFRAFARRRLGAQTLDEPVVGLSSADRGSILHDALFQLWGDLGDSKALAALGTEELQSLTQRCAADAVSRLAPATRHNLGDAFLRLEQERLADLMEQWLSVERQREVGFKVLAREQRREVRIGGLTLQVQVDRVDELSDGGQLIIDYKSSASRVSDWLSDRPSRPQLPLYAVSREPAPRGLAFAQVRSRDSGFVGLANTPVSHGIGTDIEKAVKRASPAQTWEALLQEWANNLEHLATQFLSGEAAVDPKAPTACTWCGLQPLCRIGATVTNSEGNERQMEDQA